MPTFFRTLVLALVVTAFGASTAMADGESFLITTVIYKDGAMEVTIPFNMNGVAVLPAASRNDIIKVGGVFAPNGATVITKIEIKKIATDPPAAVECTPTYTTSTWIIEIPANALQSSTNYTVKASGGIANINGTNVNVTSKQISIDNE